MSTAVLISGQMRTADICAESILKAFPDADFYIHCVEDEDSHKSELFHPVAKSSYLQEPMVERGYYHRQKGRGVHGVQQVLQQLYGLAKVWDTYVAAGGDHEWVVRCRPDLRFTTPPENEVDRRGQIMIPRFCNYWGYNDRFAMVRREVAMRYFTRWSIFDSYLHNGGIFHPETFLKWSLEDCRMVRTNTVFHTLRKDGSTDEPLYFTESGDEKPPLDASPGR
jgi:hypothetical protein